MRNALVCATLLLVPGFAAGALAQDADARMAPAADLLGRYCVSCHNERLRTGGLALETSRLGAAGEHAEVWEKVAGKLRSGALPPAGMPRPDAADAARVAGLLEAELDRAAEARPYPGPLPLLYRLTRTEYRHAIRDLLALEALPQEMDYPLLLPADNAVSGFDNIADLLFIAPRTMERYLDAARKISQLAVGDPDLPLMVNIHRLSPEQPQDARDEDLPAGTRGGLLVSMHVPLDADYVIDVDVSGRSRETDELEITVDGARVALVALGGGSGRGGRGGARPGTEFRLPLDAGSRHIGVTFVQHNAFLPEATLLPRLRSRGTQPAIASVTIRGPYDERGPGDTASRRRIFVCYPAATEEELPCAREILTTLVRRAYRRPATQADLDDLLPFFEQHRAEAGFERGIQKALERLLVSPQFLFRIERTPEGAMAGRPYPVTDIELASRLSFFLWSSIPDDELLEAAVAGTLNDPAGLERQVRRMLADPRSDALVGTFAAQWLFLGDVERKEPDPLLFRHYDATLRRGFVRETELFLDSVLHSDRSVLDLLDADYTFLNERLAAHYGIPGVHGSHFRRVDLPADSPRRGLLGHGSILTLTSYSTRTSPVLRGKFVLDNLLASPPPPPPPDVPALTTDGAAPGEVLTIRDAMVQHRANPACASCHAQMDPIGFALEHFDAVGRWRDSDANQAIDASGVLPDGTPLDGAGGLRRVLRERSDRFVEALAERLLMFAIGRNLQYYDRPAVRGIVRQAEESGYTFGALVRGVVESTPFRMRLAADTQ
jgi:mono/diheme cytochrome c family protein